MNDDNTIGLLKSKYIGSILAVIFVISSCIEPYEPSITSKDAIKFVVTGQVNRGEEAQFINISTTSNVNKPKYIPVTGCIVTIIDSKSNQYNAIDMNDGNYKVIIPESELSPGTSFKIDIFVTDGTHIVSDFDQLDDCPEVDSVYYVVGTLPSDNQYINIKGIQFYVDLNATNYSNHYFRWEAIETWEFKAIYPIEWIYVGTVQHIVPPDNSRRVCWNTTLVKDIFLLSTTNLSQNKYNHLPLHFVDNFSSPRLVYGVSLLVKQYSLSKAAYTYWEQMKINNDEQGGLYEKQPIAIKGNMHNVTNPDQQVLGYFGASTVTSKRIFVNKVEGLQTEYDSGCSAEGEKPRMTFKGISSSSYPVYLYATPYGYSIVILEPSCYDCRKGGGDTIKPIFWPI